MDPLYVRPTKPVSEMTDDELNDLTDFIWSRVTGKPLPDPKTSTERKQA